MIFLKSVFALTFAIVALALPYPLVDKFQPNSVGHNVHERRIDINVPPPVFRLTQNPKSHN
ncbi:hypothetical protein BGW80DRAFT_1557145 [Lactifluus volemus]|nr:hypothetical protein BGW80DRAFT_1557145 [Lactifluus volemus]